LAAAKLVIPAGTQLLQFRLALDRADHSVAQPQGKVILHVPISFQGLPPTKLTGPESLNFTVPGLGALPSRKRFDPAACRNRFILGFERNGILARDGRVVESKYKRNPTALL